MNTSITSPKNQLFSKFNFPTNNTKTPSSKNCQNTSFNTTNTKFMNNMSLDTTITNPKPIEIKKDFVKTISKQLISQIHFCRYLFKLIGRIKQSAQKGLLKSFRFEAEQVQKRYTLFIKHKIQKLISFESYNFLSMDEIQYKEYKETSDFKKILKISKEYKDRYKSELSNNWSLFFEKKFSTQETILLLRKMIQTFQIQQAQVKKDVNKYEKDVIILDYLITAKQLLQMLADGQNYEKFSRKSKIEEIVEGTTTTITFQLYEKIIQRGKQLTSFNLPFSYNTRQIPVKV